MARPKLKYFLTCDEVQNEQGKVSAVGIFDTIFSFIFPANHKQFFLLLGFTGEEGKHDLQVQVTDPTGTTIADTRGELTLASADHVSNVVFKFEGFPLPAEGQYTIALFMDGDFLVEHGFAAKPPMPRRERTPEEIAELRNNKDIIQSANADVECRRCRSTYKFQLQLDPEAPVSEGYSKMPPGDSFLCGKCGSEIPVAQVRRNLENIVGIPRQWLAPQQGASTGNSGQVGN